MLHVQEEEEEESPLGSFFLFLFCTPYWYCVYIWMRGEDTRAYVAIVALNVAQMGRRSEPNEMHLRIPKRKEKRSYTRTPTFFTRSLLPSVCPMGRRRTGEEEEEEEPPPPRSMLTNSFLSAPWSRSGEVEAVMCCEGDVVLLLLLLIFVVGSRAINMCLPFEL